MAEQLLSEFNGSQMSQCQYVKYEPLEEIEVKEENKEYVEYDEKKDDKNNAVYGLQQRQVLKYNCMIVLRKLH